MSTPVEPLSPLTPQVNQGVRTSLSSLSLDQTFLSWDQAFIAIVDDSHAQCHAAPKAAKSNNSDRQSWYCYYREAQGDWAGCNYRVYMRMSSDNLVVIKGLEGSHRGLGKPYPPRVGLHSSRYLQNKVSPKLCFVPV